MLYLCVQGEIIEAVISDQWCDAKITKVIPPTQAEIDADNENEDDEVIFTRYKQKIV